MMREQGLIPDVPEDVTTTSLAIQSEMSALDAERQAIAREAAELADLMWSAEDADPTAVDPELQRRQEALAERAARLNEAVASAQIPWSADDQLHPEDAAGHAPVEAVTAHGLDSLAASESAGAERRQQLIAGIVLAVGLIALVIAVILLNT